MFRAALRNKPEAIQLLPVYPKTQVIMSQAQGITAPTQAEMQLWASETPLAGVALPTQQQAIFYARVGVHEVNELVQLFLSHLEPFAYTKQKESIAEVWWLGQWPDSEGFQLATEAGEVLIKCYKHEICYLPHKTHIAWPEAECTKQTLPSELLSVFQSGLLESAISLSVDTKVKKVLAHEKALIVQCRLVCGDLTMDFLRGDRTLVEVMHIIYGMYPDLAEDQLQFFYDLVLDRIKRHYRRLPLNWDQDLTPQQKRKHNVPFTNEHTTWSYDELHNYMRKEIQANLSDAMAMANAVRRCLSHMAAADVDSIQQPLLLKFLATQSGLQLSHTVLRRQLNDMQQAGELQTHADIAYDFYRSLSNITRYQYKQSRFWRWEGSHWAPVADAWLLAKISQEYGQLQAARRAGDHSGILKVLTGIVEPEDASDVPLGINFINGFLDTQLTLHDHDPKFGQTHTLPCEYQPDNTDCAQFQHFLQQTWGGDADCDAKIAALQEMIAVTMFGASRQYQRAFLLFGVPKSGKTQLLNIMSHLVPPEGRCSVNPSDWHDRFRPALMANKRLNVVGELSERQNIDGQKFKDIVDGTPQMSEFKGRDAFTFVPCCSHWFASNHLPKTRDTSDGFYRRWLVLTFNQPVPAGEKLIRDLGHHIVSQEREAIVAWAVQGITRLLETADYTLPESHLDSVNQMASQNNSLAFFIYGSGLLKLVDPSLKMRRLSTEERKLLSRSPNYILGDTLYNVYSGWCIGTAGVRPVSSARFHTMLKEMSAIHGFLQNRIRFQNGLLGYSYVNLTCNSQPADSTTALNVMLNNEPYTLS